MPWLLAIQADGVTQYWTGRIKRGGPQRTLWKSDAKHFTSPRCAYETADTHEELKGSEDWKVVKR